MSINSDIKLKKLLEGHKQGVPFLAKWMVSEGFSPQLQERYLKSGWIESLGYGAYRRFGDTPSWLGCVYALQAQASLMIHVGALTALSLSGREHYLRFGNNLSFIFSTKIKKLPLWFLKYPWNSKILHTCTNFLPKDLGITTYDEGHFEVKISSLERAILECLYLAPSHISYVECYQIFEGLVNLRPELLRNLLEGCNSIRVKRSFLYMLDKANHNWKPFLNTEQVNIGKGIRSLEKGGVYEPKFQLVVPKELYAL